MFHFLFQCPPELFWEFQKGIESQWNTGWTLLFPTCTPWFRHQGWDCLGYNEMWGTGTNSWPTSNKNQSYQGPGAVFLLPKQHVPGENPPHLWKSHLIPRRHCSRFVAFSTHHWEDLINCWRCCWKHAHSTCSWHSCSWLGHCFFSSAEFWRMRFLFWMVLCISLRSDRLNRMSASGGPVPHPSLSLLCVYGDFQSFFTFFGWTQKLLFCLTAFLSKMNFAVCLIQIIFPEQILAQTQIKSSLKQPRMYVHWSCLFFPIMSTQITDTVLNHNLLPVSSLQGLKDAVASTYRKPQASLSPFNWSRLCQIPLIRDSLILCRL